MGLKTEVDSILNQSLHIAFRPPGAALPIAATNIFTLTGGPAYVKGFFMYCNLAMGAASSFQLTVCGVVWENAAVVCNQLIGEMAVWPLAGGAGNVIIPNVANAPYPPLATVLLGMTGGALISPGAAAGDDFAMTVAAVICPINTVSFFCLYYKMAPETLITPV